ncbi:MAG TPA: sigma-54 dependent transcriptional regulator [Chthoniobacteraceae bacterium]|nr:sigma-54 dependent transcriptional regulator [Chthoniobacteraceae bacterium]
MLPPEMTRRPKLLIIDDIPEFHQEMRAMLSGEFQVVSLLNPLDALKEAESASLIITTLVMKELDGFGVIRRLRGAGIVAPIVLVTGYGDRKTAAEAFRLGADQYLPKPLRPDAFRSELQQVLESHRSPAGPHAPGAAAGKPTAFLTGDPATLALLRLVRRVARSWSRVLITGETGTGKEWIATQLHEQSPRRKAPLVTVNCAAIPPELLESELFGHEQGAFTGAVRRRIGKFEEAGEGTLFLDEIAELSLPVQSKLLRVLQGGDFQRVGGTETLRFQARLVAATHRDLRHEVAQGRLREDLFFRLNVVHLRIPPLRHRQGDIDLLTAHFLERFGGGITLSGPVREWMESHPWPGNVRELEHFVERLCVLHPGETITLEHLAQQQELPTAWFALAHDDPSALPYAEALETFRKNYFEGLLARTQGHLSQAARLAGMDRSQFHRTVVRLGLHSKNR